MEKQIPFYGRTDYGIFCQALFGSAGAFEKTAGAPPFADWDTGDVLRKFISRLTKVDRKNNSYVLVNALGAGEYFGSNINADYFPWNALCHEGTDYGYKTFEHFAHAYQHHKNKDPLKAFGQPVLSVLNMPMKRVELIVKLDREKAKIEQADGIITRIDSGEFPDVSMGCLPKYAKILRKDGSVVAIEKIREGDEVISHRGRAKKVISTLVRPHKGTIYSIKPFGHRDPLVLTEEHPLWLVRKEQMECRPSSKSINRGRRQHVCTPNSATTKKGCSECYTSPSYSFEWVRADAASEGDYLALPLPTFEVIRKFSADEARFLGYYLAEGNPQYDSKGAPRAVMLSLGLHEAETHSELRSLIERLGLGDSYSEFDAEERNGKYITVNDRALASLCVEHCGSGAKTKKLSASVMGADADTLQILIGAYANGDGGCYKGSIYFSTASEELSDQLRIVLARMHCIASVNEIVHQPSALVKKETVEFQVWVGTDSAWRLTGSRHSPGKSEKLNSKRFFYDYEGTTYLMTPIESIDGVEYDDDVFNFEVEEDNSYVAEGLAVHNCKVPYDICSICGQKSKTRFDYCQHMMPPAEMRDIYGPNKILPDGRRIFVVNTLPKFFDISFVFIGADKTAKVMAKVASKGNTICLGDICAVPYIKEASLQIKHPHSIAPSLTKTAAVECCDDCGPMDKLAEAFGSSQTKVGEILKTIPTSSFSSKVLPSLESSEQTLPRDVLNRLSKEHTVGEAVGGASALGIVLKPIEFQRIILIRMGNDELADRLDDSNTTFGPVSEVDSSLSADPHLLNPSILQLLRRFISARSGLGEPLKLRSMAASIDKKPLPTQSSMSDSSTLNKISAAYNGYRRNLLTKLSQVEEVIKSDPSLRAEIQGTKLSDLFIKTASNSIFSLDSMAYMMGAYITNRSSQFDSASVDTVAEYNQGLLIDSQLA